jgi:tryptophan 2,3-dioxygenase
LSPADFEIFDEVFSSDSGKNSYHFEYIEYLFLEKKYELLETEVHKFIIDNTDRKKMTYAAHRFYLLSKIYQNTADVSDVLTSRELAKGLPKDALKDEFDVWAMENILAE